jgi:hypothetical protein
MKRLLAFALPLLMSIGQFYPAVADVIELKTGQRVEGALKQATPASVSVEVGGQMITFEGEKVRAIYFGAAPAAAASVPSLRGDAMRALKGLQSATEGGISYRDYGPRATDAKIIVDRYVDEDKADPLPVRSAIAASMRYYTLAGNAWSALISRAGNYGFVVDPAINQCAAAQRAIEEGRASMGRLGGGAGGLDQSTRDGISLSVRLQVLWSCAGDKLAEAEKLLGAGPGSAAPAVPAVPTSPSVAGPRPAPDSCKSTTSSGMATDAWRGSDETATRPRAAGALRLTRPRP